MSVRLRTSLGVLYRRVWGAVLALCLTGCIAPPEDYYEEDEDLEARTLRTEMLTHRARLEVRHGFVLPINSKFDATTPIGVVGVKGQIESVQKGMWFGLEFDYMELDSTDPVGLGTPEAALLIADTEDLMDSHTRYQLLFTWDYDVPTGPSLYHPIFRFGLGLGAVAIDAQEAEGNTLLDFENAFAFLARPTVGFRFPLHENFALFAESNFDFIPQIQMSGRNKVSGADVDIGNEVDFSSLNLWVGVSFEW